MNLDPFRPYADLIRWGLIALLALVILLTGFRWGSARWEAKHDEQVAARAADKQAHLGVLKTLAAATAAVAEKAAAASKSVAASRAASDNRYKEALHDAQRAKRDLAAALRRGDLQLQQRWACDSPRPGTGGAAGHAAEANAAGRYDSAARIIAAADADAAVIDWLWHGWQADRDAVIAAGCAKEARLP